MECNKDEANRAKEIAEKKFEAKDYLGSKKFALKAQSLYPGLTGIQHMLATLNVYISSENRVNGERDWYKVLDVDPKADEETIKKQYRKLALVLHPDKNKSIGADGAFRLISEAWNLFSDKTQRSVYDQKRNVEKVTKPKFSPVNPKTEAQKENPAKKTRTSTNGTSNAPWYQKNYTVISTFWTVCHRCRLQHEYQRMYLHRNLLCPNCDLPYYAYEYPPPITKTRTKWHHFLKNPTERASFRWDPSRKTGGDMFDETFKKSKKEREEALSAMRRDREADLEREGRATLDANPLKQRKVDEDSMATKTRGATKPGKGGTKVQDDFHCDTKRKTK